MTVTLTTAGPLPSVQDAENTYDVTVVGAGVVGAAIARELARHRLRTALIDAADDIGNGTSKANTAILHTGFDAVPGSLEARLVREGQELLAAYAGRPASPWSGSARSSWPGTRSSSPHCPDCGPRRGATATTPPGSSAPTNYGGANRIWGPARSARSRFPTRASSAPGPPRSPSPPRPSGQVSTCT